MHGIDLWEGHHNGHLNDEKEGFDHCVPVMAHAESREEAEEIAQVLTDHFEVSDT